HLKSAMAYKSSFFLSCLGALLGTVNVFLGVVFLLSRFGTIGGYTLPQLALCYAAILMSTSLAECFARGFDRFSQVLSSAQFDRILVRPLGLVFQVLCQDMKPAMLSRVLQAAVMLAWGVRSGAVL
ncbi:MAG: ABC-2 family transporter protein, partial [Dysosmobacter welbionis]